MGEKHENRIGDVLIASAISVHKALGPGLLESVYEACLFHECQRRRLAVRRQVVLPIRYGEIEVESGLRIDMLLDGKVVVEIKAVERILPIHTAQYLTYVKLGDFRLGYLLNFNTVLMKNGIKRIIHGSLK